MKKLFNSALAALLVSTGMAWAAPDSITVGMVLEPPNLDPTAGAAAAIDEVVYANVFEGLTRFGPDGAVRPGLASSWNVSADGKVWTFNLRPGVTFHDGTGFDAQDVKFSLDRARDPASTNAQKVLFAGIESVEAANPQQVVVRLSAPDGAFDWKMAWGDAVIVAPESAANLATNPVGTGPFVFAEWVQGDHVTLTANANYWGGKPALAKATFRFISDPTAAFAAMMAGDVDAFPNFPAPETLPQLAADPRFKVIVGSTEGETILAMNNKLAPLDNIKLREAIAHAINRQDIIDGAMFGYGTPIGTHFAPHNPDYVDLTGLSNYDPELSKKILADAGLSGIKLRLALPPPTYARRGGEIIAAELRAVGIETEITNMEWAQWLEQVFTGKDFDLTIVSHTEPMDIDIYARPDYYFQYARPDFVALIDKLKLTSDAAARSELLRQAQEMIARDYVNGYLFQLAKTGVANAELSGLWENSPTQANDLTAVRWGSAPAEAVQPTSAPAADPAAAPAAAEPAPRLDPSLSIEAEAGKVIFEETAGGIGCAACHGIDAQGELGPDIRGKDPVLILNALSSIAEMMELGVSKEEIDLVAAYLRYLHDLEAH
jgi:peptide/nickel transport system substrate-binding protein